MKLSGHDSVLEDDQGIRTKSEQQKNQWINDYSPILRRGGGGGGGGYRTPENQVIMKLSITISDRQ